MTLRILRLTFNDLTSWNRIEPRIITSKSEKEPLLCQEAELQDQMRQ